MRYLFTGGGTGGHVYPALAIADALRRGDPAAEIMYVGVRGRIEEVVVPRRGYRFVPVRSWPFPASPLSSESVRFVSFLLLGFLKSLFLVMKHRPDVIVGTGGYGSAPVIFAWAVLRHLGLTRAKTFVHEQNAYPGLLNRAVARVVDRVGLTFPEAGRHLTGRSVRFVGYPVRSEIASIDRTTARLRLGIPQEARTLLVFGGSGGSRAINRALVDCLGRLMEMPDLYILHGTGRYRGVNYDAVRDTRERLLGRGLDEREIPRYRRSDYFDEIGGAYMASDLIVCRAGAGTLAEAALCGLPAVIVPMSAAAGDHQAMNARSIEEAGAAKVVYEEVGLEENGRHVRYVDAEKLANTVLELLNDQVALSRMSSASRLLADRDALTRILESIKDLTSPAPACEALAEGVPEPFAVRTPRSPYRLLSEVERLVAASALPAAGQAEMAYLRYRADSCLASDAWQIRNVGVKLVGLLGYAERLPHLLAMLSDRTPAGWFERVLGGDFRQVGFIRRNICMAVSQLGMYDTEVRVALMSALSDPYFEVRSSAARALSALSSRVGSDPEVEDALIRGLNDTHFEVVMECASALGKLGRRATVFDALQGCYYHHNWKVRNATVRAIIDLVKRDVIKDNAMVCSALDRVLGTCVDFRAMFPLKQSLQDLGRLVADDTVGEGRETPVAPPGTLSDAPPVGLAVDAKDCALEQAVLEVTEGGQ